MVLPTTVDLAAVEEDKKRRIQRGLEFSRRLRFALEAADDLPFWMRRIKRAVNRGDEFTDNSWSRRGFESPTYLETLKSLLEDLLQVRVSVGVTHGGDPGVETVKYITVRWYLE